MRPGIRRFLVSKFLLVPVGALLLFTLTGFVLAPLVVRWYVPKYARDKLKCQASLGEVHINPFLLRFEVKDFSLSGPDEAPLIGFARLYLDCEMTGFFHMAVHFKEIRLEKPSVNLVVETDGSLNFAALASEPTEVEPKTSNSRPMGLMLGTVAITGGEVTITDRRQITPAVLDFQDLDLELRTLTTLVDESGLYSLEAGTSNGEMIAWQGNLSLAPFHSNGKIVCSRIRTASLWEFLQHIVNLEKPPGTLTVSTDYQLSGAQTPLHMTLDNFRVDLSGVALKLPDTEAPFFELNKFEIDSARFDLASRGFQISRFLVDGGSLHVGIDEAGRSNIERVMRVRPVAEGKETSPAAPEAGIQPAPTGGPPWTVQVEAFEIKDMVCDLEDVSRSLPMAAGVSNMSIRSRATIEAGVKTQIAVKDIVTEFKGVHFGVKAAPRPLFKAQRCFLEGGELNLGARTFSVARIGISEGHLDVGLDQQGNSNWERLFSDKGRSGATTESPPAPAPKPSGDNLDRAVPEQPAQVDVEATSTRQPATAQPSPAEALPWKVNIESVDIKDIAFGLEDMSRSSPVAAGIAAISIGLKASVEAGRKTQVAVKAIGTELKGLHLGVKGAPKPLFEAQRFVLEGGEMDLGTKSLTIARVNLSDGHLDVGRGQDGKINWEQLLAGKGDTPEQAGSKPASGQPSPWKFLLKSFELDNFRSEVMDRTVLADKPLYQLRDLKVRVSEIDGKSPMNFEVGFGLEQGGKVALRGKVDPASPSVEANVNLAGVVLTPVQPYIEPFITLALDSAAVSSNGVLRYGQPGGGPKLSYQGSLGVDKLSLSQPGSKETYLGWSAMRIPQLKLAIEPNGLQVGEITLSKPIGQLIIAEDRTVNLAKIVKEQPGAGESAAPPKPQPKSKGTAPKSAARPATQPAGSGTPFPFSIGKVRLEDGNMVFADMSLNPKFMTRIHALKGTVGKLSSEKKSLSEIQLDGRVDQYGMARISGALDINDFKRSTDITMVFRNVEMANISPYSGRFAGRRIKSGKLSLDLKYQIQNSKLVGDNKIIVDNLVLGEKVDSPDSTNLPLDLAVALLADSNGRIDLGLPVSGELNDPQFSIGPIIWKAIVNIITRAVTAPFRALGSLLGGGAEKFDAVEFDPGKAELLPPEKEKLKKLADALQKKPRLKLVVQGQFSPEIDGLALKQINVSRAVAIRAGVQPKPDEDLEPLDFGDSKVKGALEKLFTERFGPKALDELERAVKQGEIKPRDTQEETGMDKKSKKKRKGFARLWSSAKLYKIVPGAMSPEQSDLLAGELFARLVESDPSPDESLSQLAGNRARAIAAELQTANAVPTDRLHIAEVQPLADEAGVSAKLSLDTVATGN
jgi:uncharacterized protein involved in outer membrane biogenesis